MVRLTRAQQQERTQAAVLAAAGTSSPSTGMSRPRSALIAERAELTRGAVYSNFPGKRALYLAVLVDMVELGRRRGPAVVAADGGRGAGGVRPGLAGTAAAGRRHPGGRLHLQLRSLAGVVDDDPARTALAQVTGLEALLLALALGVGVRAGHGAGAQGAAGRGWC